MTTTQKMVTIGYVMDGGQKKVVALNIGSALESCQRVTLPEGTHVRQLNLSSCLQAGVTLGLLDTPLGRQFLAALIEATLNADGASAGSRAA